MCPPKNTYYVIEKYLLESDKLYSLLIGIPISHLHRLIIPDDVLIQFNLLIMSGVRIETGRDMK